MHKITNVWMKRRAGAFLLALPLLLPAVPGARPGSAQACLHIPSEVEFGPTTVGDTAIRETVLRNTCRRPVTVQSLISWPRTFKVLSSAPIRIQGQGTASVTLGFSPDGVGAHQGTLRLRASDSRSDRNVVLRGSGTAMAASVRSGDLEVSPARIDESLAPGHSVGRIFTIRNHGRDSLPVSVQTWAEAPGTGGDTAGPEVSILFLSTMLDDDIDNNFISLLRGLPKVSEVVVRSGKYRTPPLPEILPYDLVVVAGYEPWADPEAAGNLLADYADQGGAVVLMHRALDTTGGGRSALGGRIVGPEYSPVDRAGFLGMDVMTSHFVDHPLTQSVRWMQSQTVQNAGLQGKGRSLGYIGTNVIAAAYNPDLPVYFINLFPYEPDYSGHASLGQMFLNIVDRAQGTYNWLRNPVPNATRVFTLGPGETRRMVLPVGHAYPLAEGFHHGKVRIWTTYPQSVEIPAALEVRTP